MGKMNPDKPNDLPKVIQSVIIIVNNVAFEYVAIYIWRGRHQACTTEYQSMQKPQRYRKILFMTMRPEGTGN